MQTITTTQQSSIFPLHPYMSFKEDQSPEAFAAQLREQLFHIEDDLLYNLITYGDGLPRSDTRIPGFTWSKGVGYGILAFLVSQALDLYRLPFMPDRVFGNIPWGMQENKAIRQILIELTPSRIEKISTEVRALYAHAQKMLANAGLHEVVLTRRLYDGESDSMDRTPNYATQLVRRKLIAEHHGQSTIKFEMDSLNSFGDDGGYSHYPVTLEFRIPASDVLYCANLIASRETQYDQRWANHKHAVEPGEWVVINRAADGIVELPTSQVHANHDLFEDRFKPTADWLQSQKIEDSPVVLRPVTHLRGEDPYWGFGFEPKWRQRVSGAISGMVRGAIRGYRQGWFR
jgi:hypothetical protein